MPAAMALHRFCRGSVAYPVQPISSPTTRAIFSVNEDCGCYQRHEREHKVSYRNIQWKSFDFDQEEAPKHADQHMRQIEQAEPGASCQERKSYCNGAKMPNAAPCGSRRTAARPNPGTSVGGSRTLPPSSCALCAAASTSSTPI